MEMTWQELKRQLFTVLVDAFDEDRFAQMLEFQCQQRLEDLVARNVRFPSKVRGVIGDAERRGWLEKLVQGAITDNDSHAELRAVVTAVLDGIKAHDLAFYQIQISADSGTSMPREIDHRNNAPPPTRRVDAIPPYKYSCYISCIHSPRNRLLERMVTDLYRGLSDELDLSREEEIFLDESRLSSDFDFDEGMAEILCQSACMVVIFTPKYFLGSHLYYIREYRAMEILEEQRLKLLGLTSRKTNGLIIPVVFRGTLPIEISRQRTIFSFNDFGLANSEMSKHPKYSARIMEIAGYIAERCDELDELPHSNYLCDGFDLPSGNEAQSFLDTIQKRRTRFPLTGY